MSRYGQYDLVIVGGCGHVGLPLAIAFADRGATVCVQDLDEAAVKLVSDGALPFDEPLAGPILERVTREGRLQATTDPSVIGSADSVIIVIGTPVDEHLNPELHAIFGVLESAIRYLRDGQLVVLRSTVYPGVTKLVEQRLTDSALSVDVAFCPERIAEGRAMVELFSLPQIVAGRTEQARQRASALFSLIAPEIVYLEPEEAELAKLFTNAWRYIKFAAANQFYTIANSQGLDFERIRQAMIYKYPRASDIPAAGLAAGPCLFKDTMQLAAFNQNVFPLGYAAMQVNEGLPHYIVSRLAERFPLSEMTVGVLGMAFKAESDDIRSSLSYKLKKVLSFRARRVLCTDDRVKVDPTLLPLDAVLAQADLLIIATPHPEYRDLHTDKPVVDIWNVLGRGVQI